jgi:hypothetical protein
MVRGIPHRRFLPVLPGLTLLLALAACGGGGDSGVTTSSTIGTLAYVLTECRDTPDGFFEHQELRIRQGDHAPITVAQPPEVGPVAIGGLCRSLAISRNGNRSVVREAIQAVLVSPDGATVAFEVSDAFSVFPPLPLHIPPEQQGIFVVRSDGTGLRRLGPPSREPFVVVTFPSGAISRPPAAAFSPDGRQLAVVDKGPDANGNETSQLVLLDVASGARTQITHLPPAAPPPGFAANSPTILAPTFADNETIAFGTFADPDGSNPDGKVVVFTVKTRAPFELKRGTDPVASVGAVIVPIFAITGARPFATLLGLSGVPANDVLSFNDIIREVFLIDGRNLLQLTNFGREDTNFATGIALVDVDGERVYFDASANPPELGNSNPSEDCQIFSVDRNGSDLRQLTFFSEAAHSKNGCTFRRGPGCASGLLAQDARTRQLIMTSNCNPLGTNPDGFQVFAMNPDGTGLQQLTDARGLVQEPDGTVLGELPGPAAYGPYLP